MKHYQILNLPHNCTTQDIKKRYHELVRRYHPDKNTSTNIEFFHKIQEAYETLCDEDKRKEYDNECQIHRFNPGDFIFTEDDYQLIFDYIRRIQCSIEYRFCMSLFCKMPNETRGTLDVRLEKYRQRFKTHEFFKKMKKERILNMNTIKVIDITNQCKKIFTRSLIHIISLASRMVPFMVIVFSLEIILLIILFIRPS